MSDRALAVGPQGYGVYDFEFVDGQPRLTPSAVAEASQILLPGFVDIHIHGAFGVDFMEADASRTVAMLDSLASLGYEGVLLTTISASLPGVMAAFDAAPTHPLVLGFHLEGPFLSPKYPGAQPKSALTDPLLVEWEPVWSHPRLRIVTLAPERPVAEALIRHLSERGVIVSMGHTDATFADALAGVEWGVSHATHTFNAMRGLHHREPGALGCALIDDRVAAELIYDHIHVDKAAADVLYRCKGMDRVIAVSDASKAAGLPEGTAIRMWGLDAVVGNGDVRLADGTLAGSAITLADAFVNLVRDFSIEAAIRSCSLNPRRALKMREAPSTWILADREGRIKEVKRKWK